MVNTHILSVQQTFGVEIDELSKALKARDCEFESGLHLNVFCTEAVGSTLNKQHNKICSCICVEI